MSQGNGSTSGGKKGTLKTPKEIELLAKGGQILHDILHRTANLVRPGVSTWELNEFAENEIKKAGGQPSFKNFGPKSNPFPAALCTSVNSVVVHGIPSKNVILKQGDIVGLDLGMKFENLYTDTAITVGVGEISKPAEKIINTAKQCLNLAIKTIKVGGRIGDIGWVIQTTAEAAGFSVVRDLVGHGVGYNVHEDPSIPCYGNRGEGPKLLEGMVLAIEPMLCEGEYFLEFEPDGWTIRTKDGGLSAHFEHTVAVTKYGARILT